MGSLPTARLEVLKLAVVVPLLVVRGRWPALVPPSEKTPAPVGLAAAAVPEPLIPTVAVNVTICPDTDGVTEVNAVLVLALLTGCFRVPLLLAKLPSSR